MSKKITLQNGVHFTPPKLIEWLNKNHKKESGKLFTRSDVQSYVLQGNLPMYLFPNTLTVVDMPEMGLKMLELKPKD